jgi:hypothetical protein
VRSVVVPPGAFPVEGGVEINDGGETVGDADTVDDLTDEDLVDLEEADADTVEDLAGVELE